MRIRQGLFTGNTILKQREMKKTSVMSKLSSGLSINKAADDAAGLSISEGMRAQIRSLKQASRNSQDTVSMLQTSDGGLEAIGNVLQRMRQLSVMSLNDTFTDEDRYIANSEFEELRLQVDKISECTEYNTKKVYDNHVPTYEKISGNRVLVQPIEVISEYNDKLGINAGGVYKEIHLKEGSYTLSQFADMFDDALCEVDENALVSLNEDNILSLSTEGYKDVSLSGGATSFLYDYHLGKGPGVIYGTSDLSGRLHIIDGSNDKLSFNVGSNKYTVNFPDTVGGYSGVGYTAEEIVNIMDTQLKNQGANVKVYMKGNNIALDAGMGAIDGFSGNMIKVDGITSILYDNAVYGVVSKTQASVTGRVPLSIGLTIGTENDTIKLVCDGSSHEIKLDQKAYSNINEVIAEINTKLEDENIGAHAMDSYGYLKIQSEKRGVGSHVWIDPTSNSYDSLFRNVVTNLVVNPPIITTGSFTTPHIMGRSDSLDSNNTIQNGINDEITLTVDGVSKTLKLNEGNHSQQGVIDEINSQLGNNGLNVTATLSSNTIYIKHNESGSTHSIYLDKNSTSYKDLFCSKTEYAPYIVSGTTTAIAPAEGTTEVNYVYTNAHVQGQKDLSSGLNVTENNDTLSFNVNGKNVSINLSHQNYTLSQLTQEINNKLTSKGINEVAVSSKSGRYLYFETKEAGSGQKFSSFSGNGYKDLFVNTIINEPISTSSAGSDIKSSIRGRVNISNNPVTLDNTNNSLKFTYLNNGTNIDVDLTLDNKTYSEINELMYQINSKLADNGVTGIIASSFSGYAFLECEEAGNGYTIGTLSGGFYDNYLKKVTTSTNTYDPYSSMASDNGAAKYHSYIVGRKDLSNDIIINPNINDILSFNYTSNGTSNEISIQLSAGSYTANELVNEINSKLVSKGITQVQAQIGGVSTGTNVDDSNKLVLKNNEETNGTYIIDTVRGSAAYSIFYNSSGSPVPTYTIGVSDISKGINIVNGKNDEFSFDENGITKNLKFPEGDYDSDEFLDIVNQQLVAAASSVIASNFEGKLKLSFEAIGYNTIDNISGNCRGIMYNLENRDDVEENLYQIGANSGQSIKIDNPQMSTVQLRINTVQIETRHGAEKSLNKLNKAIDKISSSRGNLGASQNRLEHIINNTDNYSENLQSTESRIRDTDMAKSMLELVKEKLLEDTTMLMMSQSKTNINNILNILN